MRWLIVVCMGVAGGVALGQQRCDTAPAAAQVKAMRDVLLSVKVDDMTGDVPVALQGRISAWKDSLAEAVDGGMGCPVADADSPTMEHELAGLLGANQPAKPPVPPPLPASGPDTPQEEVYGGDLKIAVSTPANMPRLRAVKVSFDITCGDDTMLLLYEQRGLHWERVLRWQSGAYADISGAFGDFFQFTVVAKGGGIDVAVAHGTPWCTSRFSAFKLDLLSLVPGSDRPRVVWHTKRYYSRFNVQPIMRAMADAFELRLNATSVDPDRFERPVIYRYRIKGDQPRRVGPVALDGRDFVEEWMAMPWNEAAGFTIPPALPALKIFHDRLGRLDKDSKTYVGYTYGPVRSCMMRGRYEVEMDATPGGAQFFAIAEGSAGYTMASFGTTHDERCSGTNLMQPR